MEPTVADIKQRLHEADERELFPVSLSAQNGELSLTLEQSASLMNKGSRTLQDRKSVV